MDIQSECVAAKEEHDVWAKALPVVRAWVVLTVGLFLFAVSIVLLVKSDLGLGPWDIFHVGFSKVSGLSLGQVSIVTGVVVIGVAYAIARVKPGLGTLANMVLIGVFIDWVNGPTPTMTYLPFKVAMFASGMVLMGLASAVYISAGLGAGPRDSLMLGVHQATGRSIGVARTIVEAAVFVAGFLMGGKFGLGTILFVVGIGPLVQAFFSLFRIDPHR